MKAHDAIGFMGIGTLMTFLPALLPAYFPPTGLDGSNASALWLELMGTLNNLIGTWLVAREVPAVVNSMLTWRLPIPIEARSVVSANLLRPALQPVVPELYQGMTRQAGSQVAA